MNDFDSVITSCSYLLNSSPEAEDCRNYLNNRLSRETQEFFGFGFFPNSHNINLLMSFVGEDVLKKLNLMYTKEIQDSHSARAMNVGFFENHPLVMPYRDAYGNIIALVGRTLLADDERDIIGISKYKNTTFTKGNHVFGLFEAKEHILKAGFVYVVEGQFDVIKAFERGLKNVVALGNSNITAYQLALICRYTKNIILLLDNDEAGELGRKRAAEKFGQFANLGANTYLPKGYKDLDEYFKTNNVESMSLITRNINFSL